MPGTKCINPLKLLGYIKTECGFRPICVQLAQAHRAYEPECIQGWIHSEVSLIWARANHPADFSGQ